LATFLRKNFTIVGMPQSLFYQDVALKRADARKIEAVLSSIGNKGVARPTFFWREEYSFDQAEKLYPSANNVLMPDIAFQLGPYEPRHSPPFGPNAVDILVFLREDHESVESKDRNRASVYSILTSLVGKQRAKSIKFRIVDWNDRLQLFSSDDILFSETAIQLLSLGRVLICDRLHAAILAYLSGIPFIYIDPISGKISKTLGVALESADGCANGRESNFARAMNLTQALDLAVGFLHNDILG
jgi:exopolysaccharide biosynthesis predicted pyruvyltransferase EpsI